MVMTMIETDVEIEVHHHEVGTAGQCEIDIRFCPLVTCGDRMMLYKYIVKNVAKRHNKTATFMPKPLFEDNGTGMHTYQSIWKSGKPLFTGSGYAGLSDMALHYIGGILQSRAGDYRLHEPNHKLVQTLGTGIRSPGEPGLFAAQSLGRRPHPHVLRLTKSEAGRIPLSRSQCKSVPGYESHVDGRNGRHQEQDRSR